MTWYDWAIVLVLNGAVIAWGIILARGTHSSSEWFLSKRSLPWWAVGLSMFATNVDSADIVGVTGSTYNEGVHLLTVFTLGSALGGVMAAFFIVPVIYRLGFYTNAEYLEARYGTPVRVLSALIQLQYRSIMLGLMVQSMYLLLTRLVELRPEVAWMLIVGSVVFAGLYTAMGGLKSVVWTDAAQGVIMMVGGAVIFIAVWNVVGGWSGMRQSLEATGRSNLPHISGFRGSDGVTSPWLIMTGWTIIGCGYWTVNHTQTMRLMGTRSLWDMKMAGVFGVAMSLPLMVASAFLGVFGRAIPQFQNLTEADALYPSLGHAYLGPGLTGLVVAAVIAAAVSTFDSMGSALSAIFTRDVYARLIVKDGDDSHYVKVTRYATVGVLALGFLYLPFIMMQKHMIHALTTLIPVFVTPLMTIYILGVLAPVHRRSGLIGLLVGSTYGVLALVDREMMDVAWIPNWFTNRWSAYIASLLITGITMAGTTLILGRDDGKQIADFRETGWLERSREKLPPLHEYPSDAHRSWFANPTMWAVVLFVMCFWVQYVLW